MFLILGLSGLLCACGEQAQETVAQETANNPATIPADVAPAAPAAPGRIEKGVFFRPELPDYQLHNEYDDDGDGDGVKETHVRRYINSVGDSAFSLTTHETLWAWSLDTKGDDDSDIHKNYVIRDSNCDKVFDERYSLDAQFHVPACLEQEGGAAERPGAIGHEPGVTTP
jgi:hypothetical protein